MQVRLHRWRRQLGFIVVAVVALTLATVAQAEPWDGGPGVRSDVEQKLYEVGAAYESSGGLWEYVCVDPANWAYLGSELEFDPGNVWGFVLPSYSRVVTFLAPQTCKGVERVMAGRIGSKDCQTGETPIYGEEVVAKRYTTKVRRKVSEWKRVTVVKNGVRTQVRKKITRWKTVKVQRTRYVSVPITIGSEPIYATCADWDDVLFGAQTVAHETTHLLGVHEEGLAECFGMQNLAYWVYKLSGDGDFGRDASQDYWAWYQANRPGTEYGHPGCYPGGPLDLSPTDGEWPE